METIYDRIEYDDTSYMAGNGFNYYIEYGSYKGTALRWYVWAKDNGAGRAVLLEDSDKITDPETGDKKLAKGNVYYFISEYILDEGNTNGEDYFGMFYQNDANTSSPWMNLDDGKYSSSYAASNIRNYMKGNTVHRESSTSDYYMAQGINLNMYEEYNLTSDPLFNQIMGRSVKELYDADSDYASNSNGMPDAYEDQMDKFWALSNDEHYTLKGRTSSNDPAIAYQLSTGTTRSAGSWWLRSPDNDYIVCCVFSNGSRGNDFVVMSVGIRPAFKIEI